MRETIQIKKSSFYIIGVIIIVLIAGFFMISSKDSALVDNTNVNPSIQNGEVQKVVLSMKDYNYYPNTVTVKVGQPVSISLDKSISGCLRDFTIKEFGIRKNLKTPEDTILFTPNKKGTFRFACSMGMGTGTLIVE